MISVRQTSLCQINGSFFANASVCSGDDNNFSLQLFITRPVAPEDISEKADVMSQSATQAWYGKTRNYTTVTPTPLNRKLFQLPTTRSKENIINNNLVINVLINNRRNFIHLSIMQP